MEQEINGKVQKINDEDYEIIKIIETETYPRAVRWYKDSYGCDLEEAVNAIETFKKKYGADYVGLYNELSKEDLNLMWDIIFNQINTTEIPYNNNGELCLEDWISQKTGWSEDVVMNAYFESAKEWHRRNPDYLKNKKNSDSGCAVTLLIAITSTLSIGSLIAYYI